VYVGVVRAGGVNGSACKDSIGPPGVAWVGGGRKRRTVGDEKTKWVCNSLDRVLRKEEKECPIYNSIFHRIGSPIATQRNRKAKWRSKRSREKLVKEGTQSKVAARLRKSQVVREQIHRLRGKQCFSKRKERHGEKRKGNLKMATIESIGGVKSGIS